jgi:outer membrane protein OmpU
MNNLKKIGLTALAGSLVATSVFAGELAVTGSASLELAHVNGGAANSGKSFSQGNNIYFTGGGELDNGMTVALSFELDDGSNGATASTSVWDSHSVTIGMNDMGTFTFSGHGGSSASSAVDDTTGEIWDYQGTTTDPSTGSTSNNMMSYTNSTLMDGLSITASYVPHTTSALQLESTVDYAVAYSGVEGLVVGYANGENKKGAIATHADVTTMYANYTMGPIKVAYHTNEYETSSTTDTSDQDFTAYSLSYTVSENLSVMYGNATVETPTITSDLDQEVSGIAVSYTAGGLGISVSTGTIDNAGYSSAVTADEEWWEIDLSFAF